jgi:beta-glucosidase
MVVVLFAGRPLTIGWMAEHAPAILLAWHPGVEAGNAIADVLFGAVDPAGRLPVSFPRSVGQIPVYYDHKPTGRPPSATEVNTSKYIDEPWTPLFPFGHGLGYASFAYEAVRLSAPTIGRDQDVEVEVDLVNTAARDGEEVVQLYLHDETASTTRPVLELRRFQRVRLKAGERRTLRFRLSPSDLAVRGADMRPQVEPGAFTLSAGGSSARLISARLLVEG